MPVFTFEIAYYDEQSMAMSGKVSFFYIMIWFFFV
jgi:uncharacterized protein YacL (UPF0231 family)